MEYIFPIYIYQYIFILLYIVPGIWPPEDTPNEETIYPQKPDPTITNYPTKTNTHRERVGVETAGGKGNSTATGLYNNHYKY